MIKKVYIGPRSDLRGKTATIIVPFDKNGVYAQFSDPETNMDKGQYWFSSIDFETKKKFDNEVKKQIKAGFSEAEAVINACNELSK